MKEKVLIETIDAPFDMRAERYCELISPRSESALLVTGGGGGERFPKVENGHAVISGQRH